MSFNIFDILLLAYVAYGIVRGRQRGLHVELPNLLNALIFAFTGFGLFHWTDKALSTASHLTRQSVGVTSFIGIVVGAYFLARHFKARIRDWAANRWPDEGLRRRAGMALGGTRTLVLGSFIIVFLGLAPIGFLNRPFRLSSFVGRNLIHYIVPVYENLSGQHHEATPRH